MQNQEIQDYIVGEIQRYNLTILSTQLVQLTKHDMMNIWDFIQRDEVSKKIIEFYISNVELKLILIEGENAFKNVLKIKKSTRKLYAKTFFLNCVHAPNNSEEYQKDMRAILEHDKTIHNQGIVDTMSRFVKFSKLKKQDFDECAKDIFDIMVNADSEYHSTPKEAFSERFILCLKSRSTHELVYAAAAILEYVPNLSLTDAYLNCFYVEAKEDVPLLASDSIDTLQPILESLQGVAIETFIYDNHLD